MAFEQIYEISKSPFQKDTDTNMNATTHPKPDALPTQRKKATISKRK